jgi:phage tail sheath gpL-like
MGLGNSAIARVTGIDVTFKNFNVGQALFLPQRLAIIGQGNSATTYSTDPLLISSAGEAANTYGFGSPIHLAARALFPVNNDGIGGIPVTVYPLVDDGAGVAADGSIDLTGTSTAQGTGVVYVGGIASEQFTIPTGTAADAALALVKTAIDSVLEMPVLTGTVAAGVLPLNAKWDGESGNDISIDVSDLDIAGLTFSTTAMASGAANPDVDDATAKIVDVWETMILNCLNYDDVTTLGKYSVFGEGRWGNTVKKPLVVASGSADNFATRTAITDAAAQKSDRTNFLVQSTGSRELPWVIAARGLAKDIMPIANDNPPQNYKGQLSQLQTGADSVQESYTVRNNAIKLGASTNKKVGSIAELSDIVTFYHPDGEPIPAYRYVVDIVKLQNILFNTKLIFESDEWKGAPLLSDGTPTTNPTAKQPRDAITALRNLADSLADNAIIDDPEFTKNNITAAIDSGNPKRLNWEFPVKLSGNTEVISGDVFFGFSLG